MKAQGGEILAVSSDKPVVIAKAHTEYPDLHCELAVDPECLMIEKLHIENLIIKGLGRKRLPVPTNILIDKSGVVCWVRYAELAMDRPDPREVLSEVQKLR